MEHESFEDEKVAEILNEQFVSIKVDREERPDIDQIYMGVCQAMTGQGGWPLTIVMTPEKGPFFAGTYFPKDRKYGRAGLLDLLPRISEIWNHERSKAKEIASNIERDLNRVQSQHSHVDPEKDVLDKAYEHYKQKFDERFGGFGQAPKFPSPHNLLFLLRHYELTQESQALHMVTTTLKSMYAGGIWDHIGFGFARYSTDDQWLVPHFEKMLYDNAMLAHAYLEAYQITGEPLFRQVSRQLFEYIEREMTSDEGGFYSAQDADSEGVEGKFYVFSPSEIEGIIGNRSQADKFCSHFNITMQGNFEEGSIPNLLHTDRSEWMLTPEGKGAEATSYSQMEMEREKVFAYRNQRVHPHKDDKILTSWNALMIGALAKGARILGEDHWLQLAMDALHFIYAKLVREDGRLLARYRDGEAKHLAYLDDYVFLAASELELHDTTHDFSHAQQAMHWMREAKRLFYDEEHGGFFFYGSDGEVLLTRPKEIYDGALPSGNSMAYYVLEKLSLMTGNEEWTELAKTQIHAFYKQVQEYPSGYAQFLMGLQLHVYPTQEIVIAASSYEEAKPFLSLVDKVYLPQSVTILRTEKNRDLVAEACPYTADQTPKDNRPTAYFCESFACQQPMVDEQEFLAWITNRHI